MPRGPLAGRHVLLVEGHEETRQTIQAVLEADGATVTAVGTADSALHVIGTVRVDLVVTDVTFGTAVNPGIWLLRQARALPQALRTPFIALISRAELAAELHGTGFALVLTKPINPMELAAQVLGVLGSGTP